jgi:hypothetical protein
VTGPDPELEALLAALAAPTAEPAPVLVSRTLALARAELRGDGRRAFRRELARLAAPAAAALPVVVAANLAVAWLLSAELAVWLPAPVHALATLVPALYLFGALGWLALFFGVLPFWAHHRSLRRVAALAAGG